jgi:outer membrane scaffolding protein for murein synthesis (MipA/OmpV family)
MKAAALAAALLAIAAPAAAQEPDGGQPLWEAGVGVVAASQQAYPGASQNVRRGLVFPYLVYRGEFLRADRDSVGLRAVRTDRFELDIGFAGAFGSSAGDIEARRGMPDIGTLVEFGPRLRWDLGAAPAGGRLRAEAALRGVFDASDGFRSRGIAFEPRLTYERAFGPWRNAAGVGAVWGDRRLADTFYGVAPAYATAGRPAYAAEAGLVAWRLGLTTTRALSRDWRVFAAARLDSVAGAANRASPLVDRTHGASLAVGVVYTFARSDTLVPARRARP